MAGRCLPLFDEFYFFRVLYFKVFFGIRDGKFFRMIYQYAFDTKLGRRRGALFRSFAYLPAPWFPPFVGNFSSWMGRDRPPEAKIVQCFYMGVIFNEGFFRLQKQKAVPCFGEFQNAKNLVLYD